MVDVFREVRDRLDMETVARYCGYAPNRAGFIRCPFHGEKSASLKLYTDHWFCFGCQRGGSVIDFLALDHGISPLEAVKELDHAFSLGLPLDRQQTPAERREAERRREIADARRAFEEWRTMTINRLNTCFREAQTLDFQDWSELSDREALALREQATVEYVADLLSSGTLAEQIAVFRHRKEVEQLCRKILPGTPMRYDAA